MVVWRLWDLELFRNLTRYRSYSWKDFSCSLDSSMQIIYSRLACWCLSAWHSVYLGLLDLSICILHVTFYYFIYFKCYRFWMGTIVTVTFQSAIHHNKYIWYCFYGCCILLMKQWRTQQPPFVHWHISQLLSKPKEPKRAATMRTNISIRSVVEVRRQVSGWKPSRCFFSKMRSRNPRSWSASKGCRVVADGSLES